MTQVGKDTLGTRSTLTVNGKDYAFYSFAKAEQTIGDVSKLPFSLKVLLENMLRFEDDGQLSVAKAEQIQSSATDVNQSRRNCIWRQIQFRLSGLSLHPRWRNQEREDKCEQAHSGSGAA